LLATATINADVRKAIQLIHALDCVAGRLAAEGHAFSFFTRNLVRLAPDLVALLRECDQVVDPNLLKLASAHEQIVSEMGEEQAQRVFAQAEGGGAEAAEDEEGA
jgi:ATP-dependent RNA helicase DDX5/DBP2